MQFLPFAGLVGSLVLFLLSTRQFRLPLRALVWIGGAGLLAGSIWIASADSHASSLLQIAFTHPHALVDAFEGNWQSTSAALSPLVDLLCIATFIVALICLIAFSPGDRMERTIRPMAILLVGAAAGATLALAMSGIGFGGLVKRQIYVGVVAADDVHDGDTIFMGDISLRIWGVDAPELDQPCTPPAAESCGAVARSALQALIAGQLIVCAKPNTDASALRESFGRPLVKCTRQSDQYDIGRQMVRNGCAAVFRDNGKAKSDYEASERMANAIPKEKRACPSFGQPEEWRKQQRA